MLLSQPAVAGIVSLGDTGGGGEGGELAEKVKVVTNKSCEHKCDQSSE